jgi:hypothetical protein
VGGTTIAEGGMVDAVTSAIIGGREEDGGEAQFHKTKAILQTKMNKKLVFFIGLHPFLL